MRTTPTYIIDFDSTFTKVEALDVLAGIVMEGKENKHVIESSITDITIQAMTGALSFDKALKQRLDLLEINKESLNKLITRLRTEISDSFLQNESYIRAHAHSIYIISGGFKDFIIPVVAHFGITADHVFANEFIFDTDGNVTGFDKTNPLSQPKGKVTLVKSLHLQGEVIVIGDGYTDYEIREAGYADKFYLFTENVRRENLVDKADKIVNSFDDIIEK